MKINKIKSTDGVDLMYYTEKNDDYDQYIVIFGPPGMSIKFWIHIIDSLSENYNIIGTEYRGFLNENHEISKEGLYSRLIQDYEEILDVESVVNAHLVSWCLGSKVMLGYFTTYPHRVRSMTSLNTAFRAHDIMNRGKFSEMIFQIMERIKKKPKSINRMLSIMENIGIIPTSNFVSMLKEEEENSALINLYGIVEKESSLGSLAFYLINTPTTLKNYLSIYSVLSSYDLTDEMINSEVNYLILSSEVDTITPVSDEDLETFARGKMVCHRFVDKGSHFMLIEYPLKIARLINENIVRAVKAGENV